MRFIDRLSKLTAKKDPINKAKGDKDTDRFQEYIHLDALFFSLSTN